MSSGCPLESVMGAYLSRGKPTSDTHLAVLCMVIAHPDEALCPEDTWALVVWTIMWTCWTNISLFQLRIYFVKLSLDVESANQPHAVAPILTKYKDSWNCVWMANGKTQYGFPGDARTAQAMCLTALEWNYSIYRASPLTQNAPAYSSVACYVWLSYQILIFDIIGINWDQHFNKRFIFLCMVSL